MKYRVGVKEIWEQMYEVEAKSKEEAIQKVENNLLHDVDDDFRMLEDEFDLDHITDKEEWVIYEE